mgnify:FL=1
MADYAHLTDLFNSLAPDPQNKEKRDRGQALTHHISAVLSFSKDPATPVDTNRTIQDGAKTVRTVPYIAGSANDLKSPLPTSWFSESWVHIPSLDSVILAGHSHQKRK